MAAPIYRERVSALYAWLRRHPMLAVGADRRRDAFRGARAAGLGARRLDALRIARELHDVIAHNASVMVVQADGASYALDNDPARAREARGLG